MSLLDLPNEVLDLVARHVVISEAHYSLWQIGQLARVCVRMRAVCKARSVWRHVCRFLEAQHSQSDEWRVYLAAYLGGTLHDYANWAAFLPWKCARLAKRYGDTSLCEIVAARRIRVIGARHTVLTIHIKNLCIVSVQRDARGQATRLEIGNLDTWPGAGLKYAVQRYEPRQFDWRVSAHVPRVFWCSPTNVQPHPRKPGKLLPLVLGGGAEDFSSKERRAWIERNTRSLLIDK